MSIFDNLFKVRKKKLYDYKASAMDGRKHNGNNYRTNMLINSISSYIRRNNTVNDFVIMVQHVVADWVDSVGYLKSYKSFTVKKGDKKVK
jgi:hypothetical protein